MCQLNHALMIQNIVKEKNTKFIIGGAGVVTVPSSMLYEGGYPVICHGEGERTVVELIQAFENGSPLDNIKGISYINKSKEIKTPPREPIENLNEIPLPARDLLDMEKYMGIWKENIGFRVTSVNSSRCCPFSCKFCDKTTFGGKIRYT
jgi:anaerobic magnesium-protoporphyrin IX monomethyl ester cyclase